MSVWDESNFKDQSKKDNSSERYRAVLQYSTYTHMFIYNLFTNELIECWTSEHQININTVSK